MEGWAFRWRGPISSAILVLFGGLALLSRAPWSLAGTWTAVGFDALAWTTFLAGVAVRFWATLYIGARKRHMLVCTGPYSVCRNPLYLGTFLTWISMALFLRSATFSLGVSLAVALFARFTVPAEERRLRELLGKPYEDYCRRVPRFLPRPSQFETPATIPVSAAGLWQECRRASRWLWVPILAELLTQLHAAPWWFHPFTLP